jgi:hypothetical protein
MVRVGWWRVGRAKGQTTAYPAHLPAAAALIQHMSMPDKLVAIMTLKSMMRVLEGLVQCSPGMLVLAPLISVSVSVVER